MPVKGSLMPQRVSDKPAENGIRINNILTALILIAITWVGTSIESIKDTLAIQAKNQAVLETKVDNIDTRENARFTDTSRRLTRLEDRVKP